MADETFKRDSILGSDRKTVHFDTKLKGYDINQVDEYIDGLFQKMKTLEETYTRKEQDMRNAKNIAEYEYSQAQSELKKLEQEFVQLKNTNDDLRAQLAKAEGEAKRASNVATNTEELDALKAEVQKLRNRCGQLKDEKDKAEAQCRDLQRDVAHLTKKVDKNRNKINELNTQVETGMTDEDSKKYSEMARIYEAAIDKAEDLILRLQTEFSLAHSKAEDLNK